MNVSDWTYADERSQRLWELAIAAGGRVAIADAVKQIDPGLAEYLAAQTDGEQALLAAASDGLEYKGVRSLARRENGHLLLALLILAGAKGPGRPAQVTIGAWQGRMHVTEARVGGMLGYDHTHLGFPEVVMDGQRAIAVPPIIPRPASIELPKLEDLLRAGKASFEELDAATSVVDLLRRRGGRGGPDNCSATGPHHPSERQRTTVILLGGREVAYTDNIVYMVQVPAYPETTVQVLANGNFEVIMPAA